LKPGAGSRKTKRSAMGCWKRFAVLMLLISTPLASHAAEADRIRLDFTREEAFWVGQRVVFHIDLLSPAFFSGTPAFDLPQAPGVLLMKIPGRPLVSSETMDGGEYSVQRHEFAAFPQRAGKIAIPRFTVRFGVTGPEGSEAVEHTVRTPGFHFQAKMPPGVEESAWVVSARQLSVKEDWSPEPVEAKVGDAFTRTVTFNAPDIPGMAFPPIPEARIAGVGVYGKTPVVRDKAERGHFTGERIDTVTYVCQREGAVTFPRVVFSWWNIETEVLETIELPEVPLKVAPAAVPGIDVSGSKESDSPSVRTILVPGALGLILAAAVFMKFRRLLQDGRREWRLKRRNSEAASFSRLLRAARRGDPVSAYNELMHWLDRAMAGDRAPTIDRFLKHHWDPGLKRALSDLQEAFLDREKRWEGDALAAALRRHRRASRPSKAKRRAYALPFMNPTN